MSQPPANLFRLDGKTIFLSGAAGHLGRAMAFAFAQAGGHVILNGRTESKLQELAEELTAVGGGASVAAFDIMDLAAGEAFFRGLTRLDVLVNNAITGLGGKDPAEQLAAFRTTLESALVASHQNINAALPALEAAAAATGEASVINLTSQWGHVSPNFSMYSETGMGESPPAYGAAKAGLMQLTRYLAVKLAPKKIRVNSLSPGIFPWDSIVAERPDFIAAASAKSPMGRLGLAHEIGGPAVFLASPASSYMTGADLRIDGGWTAW